MAYNVSPLTGIIKPPMGDPSKSRCAYRCGEPMNWYNACSMKSDIGTQVNVHVECAQAHVRKIGGEE